MGEIKYYKNGTEINLSDIRNVGTYTFTYVLDSTDSNNYELILSGNGIIVISKKDVNVTLMNVNKAINDSLSEDNLMKILISDIDLEVSDFTFVCYSQAGLVVDIDDITSNAGTYTFTFTCNNSNYQINYLNSTGTIIVA